MTTTLNVAVGRVFDLLASPYRHREFDASKMVVSDETGDPITKIGQVFRMNMCRMTPDGPFEYQTDNHVTKFKPNRKVAWAVAEKDGEPLGWFWRYDLSVKGKRDQKTLLTLTYDWGDASDRTVKAVGLPVFTTEDLSASLALLDKVLRA